jgi:selenocysteine lyase/cysteine desulfurase
MSMPAAPNAHDWSSLRAQMPVTLRWAYFDHAAVAPLPRSTRDAVIQWAESTAADGDVPWRSWDQHVQQVRTLAARLLGAEEDEIALLRNTTEGVNLVAHAFPWQPGDNVVYPADDFPTNRLPWQMLAERGVEPRAVPVRDGRLTLDAVARCCDRRTRIVAVSWVHYATGWRNDLDALLELCRRHGALLFVDAIQALGVLPLDVRRTPIDFLAADGHKWLLGPEGAAVCYIRREHLQHLRPLGLGWHSVLRHADYAQTDFQLKPTAARYEGGTYPVPGFVGLRASLELLQRWPVEAIARRIDELIQQAAADLRELGAVIVSEQSPERRSGILAFDIPGHDPRQVKEHCLQRGVVLTARAGHVRISPHAYCNEDDLQRLVDALRAL